MAEIDARPLIDSRGNQYFPLTDISCVNGLPDNLEDLNDNDVVGDISNIQIRLNNINNQISNLSMIYNDINQIKQDIYNLKIQVNNLQQQIQE